jgi:uncharacterized membrane protein (DUF485 family)
MAIDKKRQSHGLMEKMMRLDNSSSLEMYISLFLSYTDHILLIVYSPHWVGGIPPRKNLKISLELSKA